MRLGLALWLLPGAAIAQSHVDEGTAGFVEGPRGATSWVWDLDGDGTYDDCPNADGCPFDATAIDGPAEVSVAIWVDDVASIQTVFVDNVRPNFNVLPPETVRVGADYWYRPSAADPAGEMDPLVFELLNGAVPEGIVFDGFDVRWTPRESDVGEHDVSLRVTDGDGGEDVQDWTIVVAPNSAPSAPTPISISGCLERDGFLSADGAVDPDGDLVSYFFEIDTDPGFQSSDLQASASLPAEPYGPTTWSPPLALAPDQSFFWRVWAWDGLLESERVVEVLQTCFEDDDYPYYDDYGDYDDYYYGGDDGGGLADDVDRHDGGCGCWPEPPEERSDSADAGIGGLALLALFVSRPRRRRPR